MKRNIAIAVVTAVALVGGGTATAIAVSGDDEPTSTGQVDVWGSDDDGRDDDRRDDDGDDDRDDLDDDARALSADVTAAEAVFVALKHQPGTAVSVEMDDDDDDDHRGRAAWEVDILGGDTWYSVWIDPSSGKVLGSEREGDADDAAEVRAALKGTSVTAEEAAKAAAARGTVTSVDLDDDTRGWEVETVTAGGDDREWLVGLNSGKVTADDDSDDRDDRGDDGRDDDADDRNDRDDRDDDGDDDRDDDRDDR